MNLQVQQHDVARGDPGYAMAALLVSIGVLGILMSAAMPVWRQAAQREKETELIFRGEQYARAIGLYQRRFAGAFPASIDVLVDQKFLRRKFKDPMTEDGKFQILYQTSQLPGATGNGQEGDQPSAGARSPTLSGSGSQTRPSGASSTVMGPRGGVLGVVSKSEEASIRLYNDRNHYDEWLFVFAAATAQAGAVAPGGRGDRQRSGEQEGLLQGGQGPRGQGPGGFGRPPGRQRGHGQGPGPPGAPGDPLGRRPNPPEAPGVGRPLR